jgi:hypothetical protein
LQVGWVVVPTITVYVVYVELAAMFRNKSAMQAGIFLVQGVWVLALLDVSFIDSLATVLTSKS